MPEEIEIADKVGSVSADRYAEIVGELRKLVETAPGVSFTVHKVLASITDDEERFTAITSPPEGKARWTPDEARRRVGRQVERPVTPQEKVSAIHTLATDEEVAVTVTSDLLRRPTVVAQVRQEDKVRVVEELTRDDHVAATVTTGLLRRPHVAFRRCRTTPPATRSTMPRSSGAGRPASTSRTPTPSRRR